MARIAPRADTLKVLYALSGNECAYPKCIHPIFNDDGLYVAELCHIEAANKGGPRYNQEQNDEQRNSINNLLFMCHRHHKESDFLDVNSLLEIKKNHEIRFSEETRITSSKMIDQIQCEIDCFWNAQELKEFELVEFSPEVDFKCDEMSIFSKIEEIIQKIKYLCNISNVSDEALFDEVKEFLAQNGINTKPIEEIPFHQNPLINRNWDINNIAIPNLFSYLDLYIKQIQIKFFEDKLKADPANKRQKDHLSKLKMEFEYLYDNTHIC